MANRARALAAGFIVIIASCKDSTNFADFNPALSGQRVQQGLGAVNNNQAVRSEAVMSSAFTGSLTPPAAQGLFSTTVLGKTFVYNTPTSHYHSDTTQTGAPANGVRYLLYAVDTGQQVVILPLQQIGTLDLTDKSTQAGATLGVQSVVNNLTVVNYDAGASVSGGTFAFSGRGFVTDGTNRLDFDLSRGISLVTGLQFDYKLTGANFSLEIVGTATSAGDVNSTLTVTENSDKLEIAVIGNTQSSNGTVKYNGNTIANVTASSGQDPVFTGTGSHTLTSDDLSGLKRLFNQVDSILTGFDHVLFPACFVFGCT